MPFWPVNQSRPVPSNAAVLRLASRRSSGSGYSVIASVAGSTAMIEFRPLSVIHAVPPAPTITPWGRDPLPREMWRVSPVFGSSHPSSPDPCAVYHTPPSSAGATSWGRDPAGTGNTASAHSKSGSGAVVDAVAGAAVDVVCAGVWVVVDVAAVVAVVDTTDVSVHADATTIRARSGHRRRVRRSITRR